MSPPTELTVGSVIADRYEVVKLLARGGMGAIYEIRHRRLQRSFALKTLAPELARDAEALARFRREADVVGSLNHPHIVQMIDWETLDDGSPCMVMELLRGEDLGARIERGPLPWSALARVADEVLAALAVAHQAGIVHRDLKPQNIFLARDDAGDEHAKLLDFGVSKARFGKTLHTGDDHLLGTPLYMSPEQADGQTSNIGSATDVWAMGAILYEMATARAAFSANSAPSILYRICHGAPHPIQPLRSDVPAAFAALVARVLSRGNDRIVEVDTLRGELRRALEPIAAGAFVLPLRAASVGPIAPKALVDSRAAVTTLSRATGERGPTAPRVTARTKALAAASAVVAIGAALYLAAHPAVHAPRPPIVDKRAAYEPPPAVSVAAPSPRARPRSVAIDITAVPRESRLSLDGVTVDGPRIEVPDDGAAHELRASAPGWLPLRRTIASDGPRQITLTLVRKPPPHRRAVQPALPKPLDP